jgi:hypothetical protein
MNKERAKERMQRAAIRKLDRHNDEMMRVLRYFGRVPRERRG